MPIFGLDTAGVPTVGLGAEGADVAGAGVELAVPIGFPIVGRATAGFA